MKSKNLLPLVALLSCTAWADANQLMGEQIGGDSLVEKIYKNSKEDGNWVSGSEAEAKYSIEKNYQKVESGSAYLPDQSSPILSKENNLGGNLKETGQLLMGATENSPNYIETSYAEIKARLHNKGSKAYKLGYLFKNNVEYKSQNNSFDRTFDSPDNIRTGYLMVGYESYLTRRFIDTLWGINVGMNFNRGRGAFTSDKTYSEDAFINLWSFPLDLGLGLNIPLSPWFGASVMAGPSGMILLQNRSDRSEDEKGKTLKQFSTGYFADVQFRFSLSDIWPGGTFKLYSDYDVTKLWLNLEARQQSYSQFQQKDVSVSGTSMGVSFTFECL